MKKRVGITGQAGFIGMHLQNFLRARSEEITLIPFRKDFFDQEGSLEQFVSQCDAIVHLAAMNRGEPQEIYDCNVQLVEKLVHALEQVNHRPHVLFSSSTQEERDNPYGRSKREGAKRLAEWASRNDARFTSLVIPNVFGPFGRPFYNSGIATFCYQLTHDLEPEIKVDAKLALIYINDLVEVFYRMLLDPPAEQSVPVAPTAERKVSEVLHQLEGFKETYLERKTIPELKGHFDVSLFNTMKSYLEADYYPVDLEVHADDRGYLFEVIRNHPGGQTFFSKTRPGITRGNHYHIRKIERFCVTQGEAVIRLRRIGTDEIIEYAVSGEHPSFVDIPIHYTHNITNVGRGDLLTLFWVNEFYNPEDPDTYYEEV